MPYNLNFNHPDEEQRVGRDQDLIANLTPEQEAAFMAEHENPDGSEKPDGPTVQEWAEANGVELNSQEANDG